MSRSRLPESSTKANKLIIRSEVLAVIRHLASMTDPPRQERIKQVKRLHDINSPEQVQDILVKELRQCSSGDTLRIIIELLMELGEISYLQEKLWDIIRDPKTIDEVKDASNLILRHLGDTTDPDLYLEYLDDPQGLIGRETIRMLEVSSENPEALIDFIDFILSLGSEDQVRLISSLQKDYPSEYLVNIYIPLLESDPLPEIWEQLVINLGETRSPEAAELLARLSKWPEDRLPVSSKLILKSLKQLQLAGAYSPEQPLQTPLSSAKKIHPLVRDTLSYQCYATISDGIGNQGLVLSKQRSNGDVVMLSAALNDEHGIIDCFGFYQLSAADFHKIMEKFHEGATKIKISPEYCAYKLSEAEALNHKRMFRLPYEFRCWKPLLGGFDISPPPELENPKEWIKKEWYSETDNLYQHPDFNGWFLEKGDEPCTTQLLQRVDLVVEDSLQEPEPDLESCCLHLESLADMLVIELLATPWRQLMIDRLKDTAYLLHCQNTHTFRNLAATEAYKLRTFKDPEKVLNGFLRTYGRKCVAEELLRLRIGNSDLDNLSTLVDKVMDRWGF